MKIQSIKFLNLNSLKGEHEIRFDSTPFTESGLFAITGPTGAGKTTILDAITVALYGRVHRHNRDVSEIMTRHTAESYSEVEFEVREKVYRAKWSLRRSRGKVDGALQGFKMELSDVDTGDFLGGHTTTLVQQAIVDLCGLDYNQFLRSVMLSQGDFTRFLKADENERSELLEKITDTGIYSEISRFAFTKSKEENERLESLKSKLSDVELLSPEERTAYEEQLTENSAAEKSLKQQKASAEEKLNWLRNLFVLKAKKSKLDEDLSRQKLLFLQHQEKFDRLASHQLAINFKPALVEIRTVQNRAEELRKDIQLLHDLLPQLRLDAEQGRREFENTATLAEEAQKRILAEEPLLDKVGKLDTQIENVKVQVIKYRQQFEKAESDKKLTTLQKDQKQALLEQTKEKLNQLHTWLKENQKDADLEKQLAVLEQNNLNLQEIAAAINSLNADVSTVEEQQKADQEVLSSNEITVQQIQKELADLESQSQLLDQELKSALSGKNLDELEKEADGLPALIGNCEQQQRFARSFSQIADSKKQLKGDLDRVALALEAETVALDELQDEKIKSESILMDYRQIIEAQKRIQKYDAERLDLKPEQPCPLCGSVHHPYVEGNYSSELGEVERKARKHEQDLKSLTEALAAKTLEVNSLRLKITSTTEHIEKLESELIEVLSGFDLVNDLLPKPLDISKEATIIALVQNKKSLFNALQLQIREVRNLGQKHLTIQNLVSEKRELLLKSRNKSQLVEERLQSLNERKQRLSKEIEVQEEKQDKILSILKIILAPYGFEFDDREFQTIRVKLSARLEKFVESNKQLQELQLQLIQIQTDLNNLETTLIERHDVLLKQESELKRESADLEKLEKERFDLFGDKSPSMVRDELTAKLLGLRKNKDKLQAAVQEKQESLKVSEARLMQFSSELADADEVLKALSETLLSQLREERIESVKELECLFLPSEEADQIALLENTLSAEISSLNKVASDTSMELKVELEKNLTQETADELQANINDFEVQVSVLNQEIGRLRQILEEDSRMKIRFEEVAQQIEYQKKAHARWMKLSAVIGSADGKKFSRYAQGLTLARLTELANRHLEKLTDRYHIWKTPGKDLELQIIDTYQADAVRPMATLSGGESFLVSLALALGLSDLASRKVQINSLFIDEGFGTLDADTLDIAISALENLQAKGKSIGIISHVEALKDRIATQIQVSKQPGGTSKIKLISYSGEVSL